MRLAHVRQQSRLSNTIAVELAVPQERERQLRVNPLAAEPSGRARWIVSCFCGLRRGLHA